VSPVHIARRERRGSIRQRFAFRAVLLSRRIFPRTQPARREIMSFSSRARESPDINGNAFW